MNHQFMGYPRPDGRVGVRNYLAIIPSVFCAVSCRVPHEGHRLHSKNIAIYDLYITSSISNYEQG